MFEAVIMGIVQGLTEFLPVSSTAHLIILPWFFKWSGQLDTLMFDVALHAGTLFSLLLCFWRDWFDLIFKKNRLFLLLIAASIPAGVAGFLFNDIVETTLRSPVIISISLILIGIIMLVSEKTYKHRRLDDITIKDALIIGLSQSVALIPGVSRSGITISSGLFMGLKRDASARFSFLLSTPIIAGATLLHLKKMLGGNDTYDMGLFMSGFTASAVTGFIVIKLLMSFLKRHPLNIFVYYRFLLAAVIIAGIWLRG